jgi:hypothetical protein
MPIVVGRASLHATAIIDGIKIVTGHASALASYAESHKDDTARHAAHPAPPHPRLEKSIALGVKVKPSSSRTIETYSVPSTGNSTCGRIPCHRPAATAMAV